MRRFCLLFLAVALLDAQTLPEPYRSIVELAHSAPPEFASEALLQVVELGKIADRNSRRDLAEQAFRLAGSAKFAVRMRGVPGSSVDTAPVMSGHRIESSDFFENLVLLAEHEVLGCGADLLLRWPSPITDPVDAVRVRIGKRAYENS